MLQAGWRAGRAAAILTSFWSLCTATTRQQAHAEGLQTKGAQATGPVVAIQLLLGNVLGEAALQRLGPWCEFGSKAREPPWNEPRHWQAGIRKTWAWDQGDPRAGLIVAGKMWLAVFGRHQLKL